MRHRVGSAETGPKVNELPTVHGNSSCFRLSAWGDKGIWGAKRKRAGRVGMFLESRRSASGKFRFWAAPSEDSQALLDEVIE